MAICAKCGTKLKKDICPKCGTTVNEPATKWPTDAGEQYHFGFVYSIEKAPVVQQNKVFPHI